MAGKKDVKLSKTVPTGRIDEADSGHLCKVDGKPIPQRKLLVVKVMKASGKWDTDYYNRDNFKI